MLMRPDSSADGVATPLSGLLDGVLASVRRELPGALGTAVLMARPAARRGQLRVVAATGVGHVLPPVTIGPLGGPSLLAAADDEPVLTADLWHDPRWPELAMDTVLSRLPEEHRDTVAWVRGAVAVPGVWHETADETGVVVLSVYLDRSADQHDLAVLTRHEPLVASAITIASVATRSAEETDRVLGAFASRAAIEQAKGAIMARWRCDADRAWEVLRMTSQQCNVKARELAVAFVEHVGGAPARQSAGPEHRVTVSPAAQDAARLLWLVLTEPAMPNGDAPPLVDTTH